MFGLRIDSDDFRTKWMTFARSSKYSTIAFIASVLLAAGFCGFAYVMNATAFNILGGVQTYAMFYIAYAAAVLLLYGIVNVAGIWMHYTDLQFLDRGRTWTPGLTLVITANRVMFGVLCAAFVATLPLFTLVFPKDSTSNLFLPGAYAFLTLMGLWCAVVMINGQKIRAKLVLSPNGQNETRLVKKKKFGGVDLFAHIVMVILSICVLYPMLNVLATSLSGSNAVVSGNITIFPIDFTWESYEFFLNDSKVLNAYKNSIIYTAVGVIYNVSMTALMAYPLSRMKLVGRSVLMKLIIFTMYFSGGTIPLFLLVNALGMYDNMWALFIPNSVWTMQMIICINGYQSIPDSLYEAAELDGAGEFTMFTRLALPLSKATLATIAMQIFMSHWNSFYNPMLYLDTPDKFPLQVVLRSMLTENAEQFVGAGGMVGNLTPDGVKNAVIVLTMIPVLLVYPLAQKYFVKGALIGSVKG